MSLIALCQDCLRVQRVAELIPDDNEPPGLCPACRGACCECAGCIASIAALEAGDWNRSMLQHPDRVISWTPDGGVIMRDD